MRAFAVRAFAAMSCLNAMVTVHRLVGLHPSLGAVWASVWLHAGVGMDCSAGGADMGEAGARAREKLGRGMSSAHRPDAEVNKGGNGDWEITEDGPPKIYVKVGALGSPESAPAGLWHRSLACSQYAKSLNVEGWCACGSRNSRMSVLQGFDFYLSCKLV